MFRKFLSFCECLDGRQHPGKRNSSKHYIVLYANDVINCGVQVLLAETHKEEGKGTIFKWKGKRKYE